MLIIPTIYIRGGKTVNLANRPTENYREDPFEMARYWADAGAELLHIADLDAPVAGPIPNADVIKRIITELKTPVQIGGHIKSTETVDRYIALGAVRVVLGVVAYQKPDILKAACSGNKGKIATHIDVRGGKVVITGWAMPTKKTALDYAGQFKDAGIGLIIYSDTQEDGSITTANIDNTREYVRQINLPTLFQADIENLNDIENVMSLETYGLMGIIVGRPIYEGRLDLKSAITFIKERSLNGADEPTLVP